MNKKLFYSAIICFTFLISSNAYSDSVGFFYEKNFLNTEKLFEHIDSNITNLSKSSLDFSFQRIRYSYNPIFYGLELKLSLGFSDNKIDELSYTRDSTDYNVSAIKAESIRTSFALGYFNFGVEYLRFTLSSTTETLFIVEELTKFVEIEVFPVSYFEHFDIVAIYKLTDSRYQSESLQFGFIFLF